MPMKIDLYTHFIPPAFVDFLSAYELGRLSASRWQRIASLIDLDAHFRTMDLFDDYVQVPSLGNPAIEAYGTPAQTPEIAARANDAMAELCFRHRDRFPGFVASLPMNNPEAAALEARRAVLELGASGCLVYTNILGAPLSEDRFDGVFAEMAALDHPLWLHPIRGPEHPDYRAESASAHELWFTFGWPLETALAMGRLVYAGIFDRYPGIKIITHHLGGVVPYLEGKIRMGFRQAGEGDLLRNPVAAEAGLSRSPVEYFRMFYADTAVNGIAGALDCGLAFFGPERCVFASDAPFDPEGGGHLIREGMRLIDALAPAVQAQLYEGTARALIPSLGR